MAEEFSSTKKQHVTVFGWLVGAFTKNKTNRIFNNAETKLVKEFDVLKMIRHHRLLAC
jgi:hypothetical protein